MEVVKAQTLSTTEIIFLGGQVRVAKSLIMKGVVGKNQKISRNYSVDVGSKILFFRETDKDSEYKPFYENKSLNDFPVASVEDLPLWRQSEIRKKRFRVSAYICMLC